MAASDKIRGSAVVLWTSAVKRDWGRKHQVSNMVKSVSKGWEAQFISSIMLGHGSRNCHLGTGRKVTS